MSSYAAVPSGHSAWSGATQQSSGDSGGATTPQCSTCVPGRSVPTTTRTAPLDASRDTCTLTVQARDTGRSRLNVDSEKGIGAWGDGRGGRRGGAWEDG